MQFQLFIALIDAIYIFSMLFVRVYSVFMAD